ncbi:MAG: hypothetical protein IPI11_18655 [Haliscomenobacter sp.]|nr:hypothetical protein [Haliscomenobacter sp.]
MRCRLLLLTAIFLLNYGRAGCQEAPPAFDKWVKFKEGFKIEPFLMFQLWSLYSVNEEIYQSSAQAYEPVDDRFNVQLRRARIGFRAQPFEDLRLTVLTAYDLIGRDALTGTVGGTNNASVPDLGIWDAFLEWRLIPKSERLFLVGGYFRPQYSRESITGAWAVSSIEKSMSQNYLRRHLTGFGPGRAMGLNLGGLLQASEGRVAINYNLGVFTPPYLSRNGITTGNRFSPVWAGRLAVSLGDPEWERYALNYNLNFYNQRKGVTFALNGAWQGQTDVFRSSGALAADVLFNWGPWNIDGEINRLWREGEHPGGGNGPLAVQSVEYTGHVRGSYNWVVGGKAFLEPAFMVMFFDGPMDAQGQADAAALKMSAGSEKTLDAGLNWHLQQRRLKLLLHYTWRLGDAGAAGDGAQVNMYFTESGVGAIRRGNWLGLGMHAIF